MAGIYRRKFKTKRSYYSRAPSAPKTLHRVDISDYIGNELSPGMIVTYASGASLKFGVYEGVAQRGNKYRVQLVTADGNDARRVVVGSIEYDKQNNEYSQPTNLVVIKNPLFKLCSREIAVCLQAIDKLKDEGNLPEDFKAR